MIGGWLAYALSVVLAFLDFMMLRDRRVPAPCHWAWSFLSPYVSVIGRGVVTNRRIGKGVVVVWVAVASIVLGIIAAIVLMALIFNAVCSQIPEFSELPAS